MNHGYYDPRTPGHHALSEEEFEKACGGNLNSLVSSWCAYIGVERVKSATASVLSSPHFDACYPEPEGASYENLEYLTAVCRRTIMSCCAAWSWHLGSKAVRDCLQGILDQEWSGVQAIAELVVSQLVKADGEERKAVQ